MTMTSIKDQAVRGLKWNYVSVFINGLIQLGVMAVMARLLKSSDYGLYTMANMILAFANYFAQMGIGQAIAQKEELGEDDINTAFSFSVLLGIGFFAVICALAPLSRYIFPDSDVVSVLRVMSLNFILNGISAPVSGLLWRDLRFRAMALITIAAYIFGPGIVGISCACLGLGVWSLVVASLSQGLLSLFLAFFLVRRKVGFTTRLSMRNPLIHYGGKTTVIAFLEYAGYNIDNLFIGRWLGSNALGICSRSFSIINLPVNFINAALSKVLFPSFARVQNNLEKLRNGLLLGMFITAMISFPVACGVIPAAHEIVEVVLGRQWLEGVPTLQVLALFMAFDICSTVPAVICASVGQLKVKLKLQFGFVLLEFVLVLGAIPFGLRGIAAAVVLANTVRWGAYLLLMRRIFHIPLAALFGAQLPAIILAAIVCGDILLVRQIFNNLAPWMLLLLEISSAGVIYIVYVVFSKNSSIVKFRNLIIQSLPFPWLRSASPQTDL